MDEISRDQPRSTALTRDGSALQDLLRLLTLWFTHGHRADVEAAVRAGCDDISADLWLLVTPQIIARIHAPNPFVRRGKRSDLDATVSG